MNTLQKITKLISALLVLVFTAIGFIGCARSGIKQISGVWSNKEAATIDNELVALSHNTFNVGMGGVVIAHSPKSSGLFVGSPSICILPDGSYVASHDLFGPGIRKDNKPVTKIYKSRNKGVSWEETAVLTNQFWSSLFYHRNNLYLLGTTSGVDGDVSLRRSTDGGLNWTEAKDAISGLLTTGAPYHCAPVPVIEHNGRLWRAMEDCLGTVQTWGKMFRTQVMSAPVDADLMKADSWEFTNALPYDSSYLNGEFGGWLEGNVVVTPSGELVNILRVDYRVGDTEKAAIVRISQDGKTASFDPKTGFIDFPGGCKKFTIRHDNKTNLYWTLSNYIPDEFKGGNVERTRNTQALSYSSDLINWKVSKIVLQHPDVKQHGFQYLDWQFDGDDIIAVSRTAYDDGVGGANNQHDANFITFHRFADFRDGIKKLK
jgi:hypothetical protein